MSELTGMKTGYFTAEQIKPTALHLDGGELKYVNNKFEFKGDADSASKVLLQYLNDNSFTEVNELKSRISELEQQLKQQWVSVDTPPENSDEDTGVLIHFDNGSIETVHMEYFTDITCGLDEFGNQLYCKMYENHNPAFTHWMPLPIPPTK